MSVGVGVGGLGCCVGVGVGGTATGWFGIQSCTGGG